MYFGFAILFLTAVPMALSAKLHEKMSVDQLSSIFQKNHHSLVPEYEVMRFEFPSRTKRDIGRPEALRAQTFGKNITTWLNASPGILATDETPVFSARTKNGQIYFAEIKDMMKYVGTLLEDIEKRASFIVRENSFGQYSLNGYIGSENLIIRPVPETLYAHLTDNETLAEGETLENSRHAKSAYHFVFKGPEQSFNNRHNNFGWPIAPIQPTWDFVDAKLNEHKIIERGPYIYPQVMVFADYDLFKLHGSDVQALLAYIVIFWNHVDLLYRGLEQPGIRFNLARIIIGREPNTTPFITDNVVEKGYIDHEKAWQGAQTFYYEQANYFPFDTYDAAVTMTSRQLTDERREPTVLGVATVGGICDVYDRAAKVLSTAITMDDGTFFNTVTTAHEVGHLLNSTHDGNNNFCSENDGYIMGPKATVTRHHYDFSECSIIRFNDFVNSESANCLRNKPEIKGKPLLRLLPGDFIDRDQQCHLLHYEKSCYNDRGFKIDYTPCGNVYCFKQNSCWTVGGKAPLDGMFCAEGKVCLRGDCVVMP